jgi:MerR family redox-sensitive transcriptional activator SoxR
VSDAGDRLTIGAVARQGGVRPSAIRYYESVGLLPTPLRVNGRRQYEAAVLDRLAVIRLAQQAGFTIAEVRTLFHGFSADATPSVRWRSLAEQKLPEVEALIDRATAIRRRLEALRHCECPTFADCVQACDGLSDGPGRV